MTRKTLSFDEISPAVGTSDEQKNWSLSEEALPMNVEPPEDLNKAQAPLRRGMWARRTGLEKGLLTFIGIAGIVMVSTGSYFAIKYNEDMQEEGHLSQERSKMPSNGDICTTAECTVAAGNIINALDESIDPCEDLFQFACGGWLDKNEIPPTMSKYGQIDIMSERVKRAIEDILESPKDPSAPKSVGMAKDMYTACNDIESVNKFGLEMWKNFTGTSSKFGGWPIAQDNWDSNKFKPSEFLGYISNSLNTDSLFEIFVTTDEQNVTHNVIYLDQPTRLGLFRGMFVEPENFVEIIEAYKQYLKDMATYTTKVLGTSVSQDEINVAAEEIFNFETNLAKIMKPDEDRRNSSAMYNPMTLGEIKVSYEEIDWELFFKNFLHETGITVDDDEVIIVTEPEFFSQLNDLISNTDIETLANYIYVRALYYLSREGPIELADIYFKFYAVMNGIEEQSSRASHCGKVVGAPFFGMGGMGFAVSYDYVKSYFSEEAKEQANILVRNLRAAFKELLNESVWMDEETQKKARDKVDAMLQMLGYPDWLLEDGKLDEYYSELEPLQIDTHLANVVNVRKFEGLSNIKQLRKKPRRDDWIASAAVVNAYYSPNSNSITFPAGFLQSPFFDLGYPRYLNYGAIGAVIGHEITHGFDDSGRQYDAAGNAIPWWSDETITAFTERAQCYVDQYDDYRIPELEEQLGEDAHVNGKNTLGENIADNGGLHEAFKAYIMSVETNGTDPGLPGLAQFTSEQLFFISYAQGYCEKRTINSLLSQVVGDVHSPEKFRVWGVVSNSPDFAEAFNCPAGSPMNRGDEACVLW